MIAIAAMSRNRVIGNGDAIPWRIPDEFRWFRRTTLGGVLVMGRRTFAALPKPLDGRVTVVLTRDPARVPGAAPLGDLRRLEIPPPGESRVLVTSDAEPLAAAGGGPPIWLCGGARVYGQLLGRCTELYLSVVAREVEGDASFPPFEHLFDLAGVVERHPEFEVRHYRRNGAADPTASSTRPAF
jgi:dihydrofolate reductase